MSERGGEELIDTSSSNTQNDPKQSPSHSKTTKEKTTGTTTPTKTWNMYDHDYDYKTDDDDVFDASFKLNNKKMMTGKTAIKTLRG